MTGIGVTMVDHTDAVLTIGHELISKRIYDRPISVPTPAQTSRRKSQSV